MKFQLNDIVIKSPGVQIREKIIEKYGSIKNFAEEIQLYENSIAQYLSSKKLGSSTFKIRTMNAFKVDFKELYKSDEEQIRYFTSMLSWHIEEYVFKDDIKILEKLKMISLERELYEDYAIVCRAYAHFYMNQGKYDRARAYIDVAVNSVRDRDNVDRYGLYLGDQLLMNYKYMTKGEFRKAVDEIYEVLPRVSGPLTKGHIHMKLGKVYFNLGFMDISREMFKNVLSYHKDARSRSFVYLWLGDVEKKEKNFNEAFSYYKEAEKLLNSDDIVIYYVYDEYALYYLNNNDLEKAERYIDRIFGDEKWKISATKNTKLKTFIQIKIACGKESEIVNVIRRLLLELEDGYIYSFHHFDIAGELLRSEELKNSTLKSLLKDIISFFGSRSVDLEDVKLVEGLLGSIVLNKNFKYE